GAATRCAADALLKLGLFNDAVSRAYYAAYHHIVALLLTEGLEARTHSGVGALLGQHFIVTHRVDPEVARSLSRMQQFRGEADDNRFFVFTAVSAAEERQIAAGLCETVQGWLEAEGSTTRTAPADGEVGR